MGGEQDMRHMGGLSKQIPKTYKTMLAATLAIAGFPPLAGFFSKDSILFNAFQSENGGHILYAVGLLTALLTSFYMFRLVFLTFYGKPRFDEHHVHVHESPNSMTIPLIVLAVLSVIGGWLAAPGLWGGTDYFSKFLEPVFGGAEAAGTEAAARSTELTLAAVAFFTALIGFGIAYWMYSKNTNKPAELAKSFKGVYNTLLHKYYVDELYAGVIIKPLMWISREILWQRVDVQVIDGAVNGVARGTMEAGDNVRYAQSGNTRSYAVWVVIGALVVIALIFWPYLKPAAIGMVR
jgi:NADH-quinone oxidoreductase subunit L